MKTVKQLQEERAAKLEAATAITTLAETESRDLNATESTQFNALDTEMRELDKQIEQAKAIEKRKAEAAAAAGNPVQTGPSASEVRDYKRFSITRGLSLLAQGKPLDGLEKEVHEMAEVDARSNGIVLEGFGVPAFINQPEQRAGQTVTLQTTNPGDQGGVTVETQLNGLIEALWAKSFLGAVGARRLAGLQGNQDFMVQDTVPAIQELTEIQEMSDDGILFSKFSMIPQRRGTTVPFSKQLLIQSSIDIQQLIIDNIRMALDVKLNAEAIATVLAAITSGNGNLISLGTNGDAPTYDSVVALEALIEGFETGSDSLAFLLNSKGKAKLRRTQMFTGTNGAAIYTSADNTIDGYKAVTSNIVPGNITKGTGTNLSAAVFGDWKYLYVGIWGGADFVVDPFSAKKKAEVEVTCNMFWNTKVARPKSFAGIKDIVTT